MREALPDAVQVFIAPPSLEALRAPGWPGAGRTARADRAPARRARARSSRPRPEFDHVIVNDDLQRAVQELEELVATMVSTYEDQ